MVTDRLGAYAIHCATLGLRLAVLGIVTILAACGTTRQSAALAAEPKPTGPTLQVVIDYGDGSQRRYTAIPWHEGITVAESLQAVGKHPRGVASRVRGRGELAFVESIDSIGNEGGTGKNWIFYVNDQMGEASAGATEVPQGGVVAWKFEVYR